MESISGNTNTKKPTGRQRVWTEERLLTAAQRLIDWLEKNDENLFLMDFEKWYRSTYEYIDCDIFVDYMDEIPSLYRLIKKARSIMAQKLEKGALHGKHREVTSIFLLKAKHGYNDRAGEQPLALPPVNIMVTIPQSQSTDSTTPSITPYTIIQPIQQLPPQEDPGDTK